MVITTPWAIMRDYDGNNHPVKGMGETYVYPPINVS